MSGGGSDAGGGGDGGSPAGTAGDGGAGGEEAGSGGAEAGSGGDAGAGGDAGGAGDAGTGGDGGSAPVLCTKEEDCGASGKCAKVACVDGACVTTLYSKGVSCDSDLDKCNGTCACDGEGKAVEVPAPEIDDNDPCTNDVCEPTTGTVVHLPISGCATCKKDPDCPDAGPCAKASCDKGKCKVTPVEVGLSCDDGDLCNGKETCDGKGVCSPGVPVEKDDGNACTEDYCDPKTGNISHFDIDCGQPSCDFFQGKATQVSCDPDAGCKKTEVGCQNGLSCSGTEPVCATSCTPGESLVCLPGTVCKKDGSGCALPTKGACSSGSQCASGLCELNEKGNKICAETSCPGCQVVNEEGTTCVNVPGGQDPKDVCSDKEFGCTSLSNCDGQGACAKRAVGADCPGGLNGECKPNGRCCGKITGICF
jgi:hypothetical protein